MIAVVAAFEQLKAKIRQQRRILRVYNAALHVIATQRKPRFKVIARAALKYDGR